MKCFLYVEINYLGTLQVILPLPNIVWCSLKFFKNSLNHKNVRKKQSDYCINTLLCIFMTSLGLFDKTHWFLSENSYKNLLDVYFRTCEETINVISLFLRDFIGFISLFRWRHTISSIRDSCFGSRYDELIFLSSLNAKRHTTRGTCSNSSWF